MPKESTPRTLACLISKSGSLAPTSAQGAFIFPTSSPVQFDPEAMKASIRRMLDYAPQAMYLRSGVNIVNVTVYNY